MHLEVSLFACALLSAITDVTGLRYGLNFSLCLFGFYGLWQANPRALLTYAAFAALTTIFDIITVSVYYIRTVSIVFSCLAMVAKVATIFFAVLELRKHGIVLTVPTALLNAPTTSTATGGGSGAGSSGFVDDSYHKMETGAPAVGGDVDTSVYQQPGGASVGGYNAHG